VAERTLLSILKNDFKLDKFEFLNSTRCDPIYDADWNPVSASHTHNKEVWRIVKLQELYVLEKFEWPHHMRGWSAESFRVYKHFRATLSQSSLRMIGWALDLVQRKKGESLQDLFNFDGTISVGGTSRAHPWFSITNLYRLYRTCLGCRPPEEGANIDFWPSCPHPPLWSFLYFSLVVDKVAAPRSNSAALSLPNTYRSDYISRLPTELYCDASR
jgi:hypothetical protein